MNIINLIIYNYVFKYIQNKLMYILKYNENIFRILKLKFPIFKKLFQKYFW